MNNFLRYSMMFVLALLCGSTYAQDEEVVFWENKTLDAGTFSKSNHDSYPEGLEYVWKEDTKNGYMKASAFANNTKYAVESRLESIVISLEDFTTVKLSFDHVSKFFTDVTKDVSVWILENKDGDPSGMEWEQVAIPNFPTNNDWNFVNSGDIDLTKYAGKKIQLGFKYTSTEDAAGTWEIKNVQLKGKGNAYAITPSNPADVAYANSVIEVMKLFGESSYNKEGALYYVKAKISKIDEVNTQYGNATFYISDDGTEKSQLMVYHCNYLENTKFTAEDQIKVGDEVIIFGHPKVYKADDKDPVNEIVSCYIYSLNGKKKAEGDTPDPDTPKEIGVAEALAIISGLEDGKTTSEEYLVKGVVVSIEEISTSYGNATFNIADNATDGEDKQVKVFRAKGFDNEKITDENIIKVGDEVVVKGKLQKYVKNDVVTPEVSSCYIYSINGNGTGISDLKMDETNAPIYNLGGQRVERATKGIYIQNGKKFVVK